MTAAFIVAAVALLALVVDTGRLYAAQAKLQSAANLAALDAARQVSGCRTDLNVDSGRAAAQASVANNYNALDPSAAPDIARFEQASLISDSATGLRTIQPIQNANTKADAVRLTLTQNFTPLFSLFSGTTELAATAGAAAHARAQIGIGTTLAGIDPPLLAQLLPIDIGAAQKGDLANVFVSLADLLDIDAGVATHQQLLETSLNEALKNLGGTVSNQVSGLVDSLADLFPSDANAASLLSILDIADDVGTDLRLNAGQIVNAAAQLAASQRDSAVNLPLALNVPGIASVSAQVRLLESGKIAEGPAGRRADGGYRTEAKSAQVAVAVKIKLLDINIGILSLRLLNLPLIVQAAPGIAHLESIECPTPDRRSYRVEISTDTSALRATAGEFDDIDNDGDQDVRATQIGLIDDLSLLFLPIPANALVGVRADTQVLRDGGRRTFEVRDLENDLPTPPLAVGSVLDTQSLLQGLLSDVDLDVDIVGINLLPVGRILDPVNALLSGPLAAALAPVLDPVLNALGVSLGNADVQLLAIDAARPELVCTSREDCGFDNPAPTS
ncbi:hypothetical protein T31B1_00115 [Salinisphaera sp. T31B1]